LFFAAPLVSGVLSPGLTSDGSSKTPQEARRALQKVVLQSFCKAIKKKTPIFSVFVYRVSR
jgi:hypothetical protein